jgi:hypothetical protein
LPADYWQSCAGLSATSRALCEHNDIDDYYASEPFSRASQERAQAMVMRKNKVVARGAAGQLLLRSHLAFRELRSHRN